MEKIMRLRSLIILPLLAAYAGGAAWTAGALRRYVRELPPIEKLQGYTPSLVTKIYDVRGDLISELFVERRAVLALPDIPENMKLAVIATEDGHFYEHWGVSPKGILRAFLANLRAGRTVQGGSTITQQLAKNIFLSRERTLDRKVKELLLTLQMETSFSKDEILQLYLNQIYFGHGAYGVESAARVFFGKPAARLTLAECALLAGLPRAPQTYSPFLHPHRAVHRRSLVLRRMREQGFINEAEELAVMAQPLALPREPLAPALGSYFVEHVRRLLEPKYGSALHRGGLAIHTTLDLRLQKAAEDAAAKHLALFDEKFAGDRMDWLLKNKKISKADYEAWKKRKEKPEEKKEEEPAEADPAEPVPVQGAFVAVDPQTGGIRALVGGRDFEKSKFNRAVQAKRQPGSAFKPFVYLSALEAGLTAGTVVNDYPLAFTEVERNAKLVAEATSYMMLREMVTGYYTEDLPEDAPDPVWTPQNWDRKYLGPITLRKGLALSRNLATIRLIDKVGPRSVAEVARRAGIQSPLDAVLSLGLGTSVVTPLELAGAYATFANGGTHMQPHSVLRVLDKDGRLLEEHTPQGRVAVTPQNNFLFTRLLQAVVREGTGRRASVVHKAAAGKTGTTQDQRDVWFAGFVPGLAAVCWIGYDDFVPLGEGLTSVGTSVPWWTDFMLEAVKLLPGRDKDFDVPPGIVFAKIDADTGFLALPSCPRVILEAFRKDRVPQEFCAVDHEGLLEPLALESEITE
ncbi:MAG: penicillin-binding protein 1A [Elusimicrobiota bacterium]